MLAVAETIGLSSLGIVYVAIFPAKLETVAYIALLALPGMTNYAITHSRPLDFEDFVAVWRTLVGRNTSWQFIVANVCGLMAVGASLCFMLILTGPQRIWGMLESGYLIPLLTVIMGMQYCIALFIGIRTARATLAILLDPTGAVTSIPSVWAQRLFSSDFTSPPELIPGLYSVPELKGRDPEALRDPAEWISAKLPGWAYHIGGFLCKVAFKATAFIALPLIFISQGGSVSAQQAVRSVIERYRFPLTRVSAVVACVSMVLFFGKILLFSNVNGMLAVWDQLWFVQAFEFHVAPRELPVWHIISFVNAVLVLILLIQVTSVFTGVMDFRDSPDRHEVRARWIVMGYRASMLLSIYVLACMIALCLPPIRDLPPIRWRIWPP